MIKNLARKVLFPTVLNFGIERLFLLGKKNTILNIYYHGVVEQDSIFFSPRHLTSKTFEKHLKYYKKHFDIISLEKAFEFRRDNIEVTKPTITISFDDGYLNNFTKALPLIEKYNVPATFFISGVCTENDAHNLLWTDILAFAKYFFKSKIISLKSGDYIDGKNVSTGKSIKDDLKVLDANERDLLIDELKNEIRIDDLLNKVDNEIWQIMSKEDIQKTSSSKLIDIQSHGYNHYNLGNISIQNAELDMQRSKSVLEEVIQKKVSMLCFPDGSYNREVIKVGEKVGYDNFICCDLNSQDDKEVINLMPRYGIANTTTFESNMFFVNKNFKSKGVTYGL